MEGVVCSFLLLFSLIDITKSCKPCFCGKILHVSTNQYFSAGDCDSRRNSVRVNKIPTSFSKDIEAIDMEGQIMTYLDGTELRHHSQIKYLDARSNRIEIVGKNTFRNMIHLSIIDLSNNTIKELPSGLFSETPILKIFSASDNNIKTLPDNLFENLLYLKEIYFDHNEIKVVGQTCFKNLSSLEKIDLKTNFIRTLYINFHEIPNIRIFHLEKNPWQCDDILCDLIDIVTTRKLWGASEIPICDNKNDKRWDQLDFNDFQLSIITNITSITEGQDLILQCKYCFVSNLTWTFNRFEVSALNVQIDEKSRVSTIVFNNIQKEENGKYICHVQNCKNCESSSIYVNVTDRLTTSTEDYSPIDYDSISINLDDDKNKGKISCASKKNINTIIPIVSSILLTMKKLIQMN